SIFGLWNILTRIPADRFEVQSRRILSRLDVDERARQLNPYVVQTFRGVAPKNLGEGAMIYGNLFARNDSGWQSTLSVLIGDAVVRLLPNRQKNQYFALREQSDMLELVHPGTPPRAPSLVESATPKDSPVFIRGEAENPGAVVPRRFL